MATPTRTPKLGETVLLLLGPELIAQYQAKLTAQGGEGNTPQVGDQVPMVIVKVWGSGPGCAVNGKAHMDGNVDLWICSATEGNVFHTFRFMD